MRCSEYGQRLLLLVKIDMQTLGVGADDGIGTVGRNQYVHLQPLGSGQKRPGAIAGMGRNNQRPRALFRIVCQ